VTRFSTGAIAAGAFASELREDLRLRPGAGQDRRDARVLGPQVAAHDAGDVMAAHRADPIEVDVPELRIAGDGGVPAERARAALRSLELSNERGLGRDPRLVELS